MSYMEEIQNAARRGGMAGVARYGARQKLATRDRYRGALEDAGERGRQASDVYYGRALEYDPQESVRKSAEGAWGAMKPELERTIGDLRGQQVGMGRIDTGFATTDEDRVVEAAYKNLGSEILRNSMAAENLAFQNLQGLGGYGRAYMTDYYDLISGQLDRDTAERNAKRMERAAIWSGIGDLAGKAMGFFLPTGA